MKCCCCENQVSETKNKLFHTKVKLEGDITQEEVLEVMRMFKNKEAKSTWVRAFLCDECYGELLRIEQQYFTEVYK